jgi:hypothetical protein
MRKIIALPCVILALVIAMSLGASSASASAGLYCSGVNVNSANKCWGVGREFSWARAFGSTTGVCVGFDATAGTCAPVYEFARVYGVPGGTHYPWVIGVSPTWTQAYGEVL